MNLPNFSRRCCATVLAVILVSGGYASAGIIWYTTESNGGGSHLFSIDTMTKIVCDRGVIRGMDYLTDIAMADDGRVFGVGWKNAGANGNSSLYEITPGSAASYATYQQLSIKSNKLQNSVNALAWNNDTLYAASANGKLQCLTFDGKTWQVKNEGSMNFDSGGDLAFGADGSLYVALNDGSLGSVSLSGSPGQFGKVTKIGNTGFEDVFGLATIGGVLYGLADNNCLGKSSLIEISTTTGEGKSVYGSIAGDVWGATGLPGDAVPEPATLALLMAGGSLLCLHRRRAATR